MPLIRLINEDSHGNKVHVDKMIRVEGIPEKLLYYKREGKNFLKAPWQIDVSENIPEYIKRDHQPTPFIVNVHTPSTEKGVPPIDEALEAYGLSLDCQNGLGEDTWQQIERMIDQNTPRGERVPLAAVVAPQIDNDHRDGSFSIRSEDIPVVILEGFEKPKVELIVPRVKAEPVVYACEECAKSFSKEQGLRMHKMKAHKKVAVGA